MKTNLKTKKKYFNTRSTFIFFPPFIMVFIIFSRDFHSPNWMVHNSFYKTVSNVIIHIIKSTSIFRAATAVAVCNMPIIHIIKRLNFLWFIKCVVG